MSRRYPGGVVSATAPTVTAAGASGLYSLTEQTQYQGGNKWPPFKIGNSLRFRSAASAYLSRTPSVAGNSKTWTYSAWHKRGSYVGTGSGADCLFSSSDNYNAIRFTSDDHIIVYGDSGGTMNVETTDAFRDPAAWYHIVVILDTTQATSSDRVKIYVNNRLITSFTTSTYPSQNATYGFNTAIAHAIGRRQSTTNCYLDGQLSEINFVDGQALTPSSFGGTDKNGIWSPIAYTGSYGTNGFYLPFNETTSATTLGYDKSGNGNNWTLSGFNVSTANTTYDIVNDAPVDQQSSDPTRPIGNYATFNAVFNTNGTISNGNLTTTGNYQSNIGINTGKFYWEVAFSGVTGYTGLGFTDGPYNNYVRWSPAYGPVYPAGNVTTVIGTQSTYSSGTFMCALDFASGKYWMGMNGTWFASGDPAAGTNHTGAFGTSSTGYWFPEVNEYAGGTSNINFGQIPFTYTPPSGFKTLCTTNLPDPTIKQPNQYFDATIWSGDSVDGRAIPNSGTFQPDLIWTKARNQTFSHLLYDSIRGGAQKLTTNSTDAEVANYSNGQVGFTANGFNAIAGSGGLTTINESGTNYIAWEWKAASSNTTNTDGSITSIIRANPTAGFSIVTYTSTTGTVGHGLGVAPAMIIMKGRNVSDQWTVGHKSINGGSSPWNYGLALNATSAQDANSGFWNNTAPTSTVFSQGSWDSGYTKVAYCFAEIDGYSKFGSYTGNASTDGPFVYCGFRPKYVMVKSATLAGENWYVLDSSRSTYNATTAYLSPNGSGAEASPGSGQFLDFTSNGFKVRVSNTYANDSGTTYIYAAFAENPFKYARAR